MNERIRKKRIRRQYEAFTFRLFSAQPEWKTISRVTKMDHSVWQTLNNKVTHKARVITKLSYERLFQLANIARKLGLKPTLASCLSANRNHALN